MIIVDTNVISELMKPSPDERVRDWIAQIPPLSLYISAITQAELSVGVAILPAGRPRTALIHALTGMFENDFSGRILPFDSAAATCYASVISERRAAGRPIQQFDAQIASIARARGAALATRNIGDFEGTGIQLIDPWYGGDG